MTELLGEKIEDLLWKAGADTERVRNLREDASWSADDEEDAAETWELHVTIGDIIVVLSEIFLVEGKWTTEAETLTLEKIYEGAYVESDLAVVSSEEELVEHILKLGGE